MIPLDFISLTIQTFDDSKERGRKDLAQIFQYDLDRIGKLNQQGAGIFFPINPQLDQTKRSIENTSHFKAITLDLDVTKESQGLTAEEISNKKLELLGKIKSLELLPNYVIETKNGLQPVWEFENPLLLDTTEKKHKANEYYQRLIHGFAEKTGLKSEGDNLCRVVRLPDTLHQKNPKDPFRIALTELNVIKPTIEQFIKTYPPITKEIKKPLELVINGSKEGSRNIDATSLVGSLLYKYPRQDWELFCWPIIQAWNDRFVNPPLGERELRSVFDSISKKEFQNHQPAIDIKIPSASEFLKEEFGSTDWLIENLIPAGGSAIIVAKRESFKTWLALYLSNCITKGLSLWNKIPTHKDKVLYITNDDPSRNFQKRLSIFNFDNSFFVYHAGLTPFTIEQANGSFEAVKKLVSEVNIGLVIVDILRNTHNKDSNTDKEAKLVFDKYKELREGNPNLSFIFLIHPSKEQALEKKFGKRQSEEAVGSYYWEAAVDTVISLTKTVDELQSDLVQITVTKNKQSDKKIKPFIGVRRKVDSPIEFIYEEVIPEKLKLETAKDQLLQFLEEKEKARRDEIIDFLVATNVCSKRTAEQAISICQKEGNVSHTQSKPYFYYLSENIPQTANSNNNYGIAESSKQLQINETPKKEPNL